MAKIVDIEGIGPVYEEKLKALGIRTVEQLLRDYSTKKARQQLAKDSGISERLILTWVNHADLFRIKGVGPQYSELLEASGVDSVPELAQRRPDNLVAKMQEVNAAKRLVRRVPVLKQVESWVEQAKKLPKLVTH